MQNTIQTVFGAALLLSFGTPHGSSPIPAPSPAKTQLSCGNFALEETAQNLSTSPQAGIPCRRYGQP